MTILEVKDVSVIYSDDKRVAVEHASFKIEAGVRNENERFVEMGKRIRARRLSLKMKQMELAEKVDISNNHISSIERGIERPGLDSFIRICDVLDVTPDYLLLGSMKSNNVPKNITDNLKLCTDEEIRLVEAMTQYLVEQHKK